MRSAWAQVEVPLAPEAALALWTDVSRWPSFVEGFARPVEVGAGWPHEGSRVMWESIPGGRGKVTEQVIESGVGRFATRVFEQALHGVQTLRFAESSEGTRVRIELEYELFIRRALRDSLRRTLRRFAVEAQEDAGLR
jgi:Polyketide cyclase / dehydrase and lipid transport